MSIAPGLGIIGGGVWAQHHMNAVRDLERSSQARLVGMCARTHDTVSRVSGKYGIHGTTDYTKLIGRDDIHAVSIVTPNHLHREMAIAAMEAGKHVIVEKPMDLTVSGCEQMIQVAKNNKVLLFVGTDGILELDTQDRGFRGCFGPESTRTHNVNSSHRRKLAHDTYEHTGYFVEPIKDFVRLVRFLLNGGSMKQIAGDYPSGEDGLESTRIAAAVHRSIEEGLPVTLRK